jgi:hypothetical protein
MGFAHAIMAYIDNIDQEGLSVQAKRRSQRCVQDDLLSSFKDASTSHMKAEKFAFTFQVLYRSDSEHLRNYNIRIETKRARSVQIINNYIPLTCSAARHDRGHKFV